MPLENIDTLIDKSDNFEIVRDQIFDILVSEVENQKTLAVGQGKEPELWDLRVYKERFNPWEPFLNKNTPTTPLVNVWLDIINYDERASDVVKTQKADAIYNIDIYGFGVSQDLAVGFSPGDRAAALEAQRALKLVRNILMAGINTYLQLRDLVWSRWIDSITAFQPELDGRQLQRIFAINMKFHVAFTEESPQYTPGQLDVVGVNIKRDSDDLELAELEYDYTT